MKGLIIKNISNSYTVLSETKEYICKARGKFKNNNLTPLVGDVVEFSEEKNYILGIEKRKNYLKRPVIANVDAALVLTSVKRPDFSPFLLDKMLVNIEASRITPIIIFTKVDLLNDAELEELKQIYRYYESIGYDVLINTELDKFKTIVKDKIVVLTGQTGVGKSTLLNKLDNKLQLKTDDISDSLNRGKHTTRHVELYNLGYAFIADTPGFSAFDIENLDKDQIRFYFKEFKNDKCKFRDCIHKNEVNCQIQDDLKSGKILKSRYESYLKMVGICK